MSQIYQAPVAILCLVLFAFGVPVMSVAATVNINTAGVSELQTLTGIGAVKAQAIIDYRATNGSFTKKEDIQLVSGIGPATYENIKNFITVSGASTVTSESEGAGNAQITGDTGNDDETVNIKPPPIQELIIIAPEYAFVDQRIEFDVEPRSGTNGRLVRYAWSFGDTHSANHKNPVHSYAFPGTYIVTVESRYLKQVHSARFELTVLPVQLSLSRDLVGNVIVENHADYEIDLRGMQLNDSSFVFPEHTIVLPNTALHIAAQQLALKNDSSVLALSTADGRVVAVEGAADAVTQSKATNTHIQTKTVANQSVTFGFSSPTDTATGTEVLANEALDISRQVESLATASEAPATERIPTRALPYIGLIGVLTLGIAALFVRRSS